MALLTEEEFIDRNRCTAAKNNKVAKRLWTKRRVKYRVANDPMNCSERSLNHPDHECIGTPKTNYNKKISAFLKLKRNLYATTA